MKKRFIKKWHIVVMLILPIVLPIIYHFVYYFPAKYNWLVAQISIGELMEYTGTTIGSIFLFFTVYLTIRNTRKDSKIEKMRDAMAEYLKTLSPSFCELLLLQIKDPFSIYETINKFQEEETKNFLVLFTYLTDDDKKLLLEFNNSRNDMIDKHSELLKHYTFIKQTKTFAIDTNDIAVSITDFGNAVAKHLACATNNFPKIFTNYEGIIF